MDLEETEVLAVERRNRAREVRGENRELSSKRNLGTKPSIRLKFIPIWLGFPSSTVDILGVKCITLYNNSGEVLFSQFCELAVGPSSQ